MKEGYLTPKEEKYTEAEVVLREDTAGGERFWVVERCPYCGQQHRHQAGNPGDDPRSHLGHKQTACRKKYPTDRGYVLVEKVV